MSCPVQKEQCPQWGQDFNCIDANTPEDRRPKLIAKEYRKIFKPHECDLPEWDAAGFERCAAALCQGTQLLHIAMSAMLPCDMRGMFAVFLESPKKLKDVRHGQ